MDQELHIIQSDAGPAADIRRMIEQTREGVARIVNTGMTLLYWRIGKRFLTEVLGNQRADYGDEIVATLSRQLQNEYGRGFSEKNLRRMVQFAEVFPAGEIVATLSRQLGWSHFKEIIPLKNDLQREFYAEMCRVERWSVRTLREKIGSMLFERTAISKKPEEVAKAELANLRAEDKLTPDLVFRDPYVLDFLGLKDRYMEKDLEDAILRELEKFLLELGTGFTFQARQFRISIDSDDYHLDLLFYHRALRRLVAIELHPMRYESNEIPLCLRTSKRQRRSILHRIHKRPQSQVSAARTRNGKINSSPIAHETCVLRGLSFSGRRHQTGEVSQNRVGQALHQRSTQRLSHGVKLGDFKPEYKGQMELYLRWLAKHEQQPGEEPPLGLILCAGKKKEQIELLELGQSGIHVAEYLTALPSRELLRQKLHTAIETSRARLDNHQGGDA